MGRNKSSHIGSAIAKINNNDSTNHSYATKQISKLLDSINVKIISQLVSDPTISSFNLAKNLDIPLSTLQRRRAIVEKEILKKNYTFNYKACGGRVGDLIVNVDKGKSREIAQSLLKKYKNNIVSCDTRINSEHNVSAHVIYKNTEEVHELIESIKTMDYVDGVQWSEMVEVVGDNSSEVVSAFFSV